VHAARTHGTSLVLSLRLRRSPYYNGPLSREETQNLAWGRKVAGVAVPIKVRAYTRSDTTRFRRILQLAVIRLRLFRKRSRVWSGLRGFARFTVLTFTACITQVSTA
jgi:hypothetical protein